MKKALRNVAIGLVVIVGLAAAYRHFVLVQPLLDKVRDESHDPASVQFRNIRLISGWTPKLSVICGEANAKNLLGAYTGFKAFEISGSEGKPEFEADIITEMVKAGELHRCPYDPPWWGVPF